MFENCTKLKSLDLYNWDPSTSAFFESMFENCESLEILTFNRWKTKNAKIMLKCLKIAKI